jgi:alpha-tubulin suppressor-like RCC1 family protein
MSPQASASTNSGVLTWGGNLGAVDPIANTAKVTVPVPITGTFVAPVVQVATGGDPENFAKYSLAVLSNGFVEAWGDNQFHELGDPSVTAFSRSTPLPVPGLTDITQVATEMHWVMALGNDGRVRVWGADAPTGDSTSRPAVTPSPVVVPNLSNIVQIAATFDDAYALDSTGHVWMWGDANSGQAGSTASGYIASPRLVTQVIGAVQIAAEFDSVFAVLGDGTVMAWGNDANGELGRGPGIGLIPGLTNVAKVFAGRYTFETPRRGRAFAVLRDGTVMGWGDNEFNNLMGVNGFASQLPPTVIPGLSGIRHIAVGGQFNVALGVNGTVTVWGGLPAPGQSPPFAQGSNGFGQYGDGTIVSSVGLHSVAGLSHVTQVAAGQTQILALTTDSSPGTFVPNTLGHSCLAASNQLQIYGLVAACDSTNSASTVEAQSVAPGTTVRMGSTIQLTMRVTVPNLVGAPQGVAESVITGAGLVEGGVATQTDTRICAKAGTVASQSLTPNARVLPGAAMFIVVWVAPKQGCF